MQPGMARTQKMLMHFHAADEKILEIDNRSLIYQMPDRPYISPEVFKNAGVMPDIFPDKLNDDVEMFLIGRADEHARCYGMLNWGDTWDSNYTQQATERQCGVIMNMIIHIHVRWSMQEPV